MACGCKKVKKVVQTVSQPKSSGATTTKTGMPSKRVIRHLSKTGKNTTTTQTTTKKENTTSQEQVQTLKQNTTQKKDEKKLQQSSSSPETTSLTTTNINKHKSFKQLLRKIARKRH